MVETTGLVPVGVVGPSRSRSWCPAAALRRRRRRRQGIRYSRALPRLGGALLRCRRRARGGRLYRSPCGLRFHRLLEVVVPMARIVKGTSTVVGVAVGWGEDRAQISRGACRRRASILGRRSSGCVPGRCAFIDVFIPSSGTGDYCGSFESNLAMGLLQICGGHDVFFDGGDRRRIDDGGRWRLLAIWGITGSRVLNEIYVFLRGLCVRWWAQLSMYPFRMYLYSYVYLYVLV